MIGWMFLDFFFWIESTNGLACWFGARWIGFLESPKMKGISDWDSWDPIESQTTKRPKPTINRNHKLILATWVSSSHLQELKNFMSPLRFGCKNRDTGKDQSWKSDYPCGGTPQIWPFALTPQSDSDKTLLISKLAGSYHLPRSDLEKLWIIFGYFGPFVSWVSSWKIYCRIAWLLDNENLLRTKHRNDDNFRRFRHTEYVIEVDDCGKVYTRSRRRREFPRGGETTMWPEMHYMNGSLTSRLTWQ